MRALIVEPGKKPYVGELSDLKAMQKCVGGHIQAVYPWKDAKAALVCDEEGLFHDSCWNRFICEGLAIKGTFFICGLGEEDFEDLPDDLIHRFEKEFHDPHVFVKTPRGMLVLDVHGTRASI